MAHQRRGTCSARQVKVGARRAREASGNFSALNASSLVQEGSKIFEMLVFLHTPQASRERFLVAGRKRRSLWPIPPED